MATDHKRKGKKANADCGRRKLHNGLEILSVGIPNENEQRHSTSKSTTKALHRIAPRGLLGDANGG
jgi:hypothetical protein